MAARASSGVGCSRNCRTRPVACSSSSRLGVYAGADSPMASPATTGSTPLACSASHRIEPDGEVDRAAPHRTGPRPAAARTPPRPAPAAVSVDPVAVDDGDHDQRGEVVDDEDGEDEHPHPVGHVAAEHREQAERERGVGGHRDAPPVRARQPRVEQQVDPDRHGHADHARHERQHEPAALAQVAEVELAPRLQADDQEEQRHQAAVDPRPQVLAELRGRRSASATRCPTPRRRTRAPTLAQTSATTTAATSTTALADSVLTNARSGAAPRRVQSVRSPVSTTGGQYVPGSRQERPGAGLDGAVRAPAPARADRRPRRGRRACSARRGRAPAACRPTDDHTDVDDAASRSSAFHRRAACPSGQTMPVATTPVPDTPVASSSR